MCFFPGWLEDKCFGSCMLGFPISANAGSVCWESQSSMKLRAIYFGVILICLQRCKEFILCFWVLLFYFFFFFSLKNKVILILQGSTINGIKILAVQLWALMRWGSLLADCPWFSPLCAGWGTIYGIKLWVCLPLMPNCLWDFGIAYGSLFWYANTHPILSVCKSLSSLESRLIFLVKELNVL